MILFMFLVIFYVFYWNNVMLVFCDIDEEMFMFDLVVVEVLIILCIIGVFGVYVYGMLCDVVVFDCICENYGIKVFYDVVYVFGMEIDGVLILCFGDVIMFSFYVMKLFNLVEGGGLVLVDVVLKKCVDLLKNFGILNEIDVIMFGINGKMNEI